MPSEFTVYKFLDNQYVAAIIGCLVVVYASQGQINLPKPVRNIFKNDIFRIIFLSLLVLIGTKSPPHVALAIAIIFVLTLHFINRQETFENFKNIYL